jgi:hypothetical protein
MPFKPCGHIVPEADVIQWVNRTMNVPISENAEPWFYMPTVKEAFIVYSGKHVSTLPNKEGLAADHTCPIMVRGLYGSSKYFISSGVSWTFTAAWGKS